MASFCSECGKPTAQDASFCTNCGTSLTGKTPVEAQWQDKREKVLGKQQNGGRNSVKVLIWIVGISFLGGWLYMNLPESGNPVIKASPVVTNAVYYGPTAQQMTNIPLKVENGKIAISLDLLREKKFVRFMYGDASTGIPLLAYISSEGKIVTAVSVCEPCNSTAFHISGDKIICNSCGSTWELNDLQVVSGSCGRYPPDAVPNSVVGDEIRIDEQVVSRWQRRV